MKRKEARKASLISGKDLVWYGWTNELMHYQMLTHLTI